MNMNRCLIITVAVIAIMLAVLSAFLMGALVEEKKPLPAKKALEVPSEEGAKASYLIPENSIPSAEEVATAIEKREEARQSQEQIIHNLNTEMDIRRQQQRSEALKETHDAISQKTISQEVNPPPPAKKPKPVIFPTKEEIDRMRSEGIIAY